MVVANGLQQQVDMLSKERDSYIDLWQQTTTELKAIQKSHQVNLNTGFSPLNVILVKLC